MLRLNPVLFVVAVALYVSLCCGSGATAVPAASRWEPLLEPGCGGWVTAVAPSPHDARRVLIGGDMLGVGVSSDAGETWQSTTGLPSWEIGEFTYHPTDPNRVWVGTMSGPCLSQDGGRTWVASRAGAFPAVSGEEYTAPIQKILFDPNKASRLIAVGGSYRRWQSPGSPAWGAIWESLDGGGSWKQLSTLTSDGAGANIVSAAFGAGSSSVIYASVDGGGIHVSVDGGRTWVPRNAGLPHQNTNRLAVHPTNPRVLWVALDNHRSATGDAYEPGTVYKTVDGGMTWLPSGQGLGKQAGTDPNLVARYQSIAVHPKDANLLITSNCAWANPAIYMSRDGGVSWRAISRSKTTVPVPIAYPAGFGFTVTDFSPLDTAVAFVAGSEYCLKTSDAGLTWRDVTAQPVSSEAWRGTGYSGLCAANFRFDPYRAGHAALLALDHGNFWQSNDSLKSWVWGGKDFPSWNGGSDVAFTRSDVMYVTLGQFGSNEGIGRTKDGGRTWDILSGPSRGLPDRWSEGQPVGIYALPDKPDAVWATVGGRLYHSADGGQHWKPVNDGPGLGYIAADPTSPLTFYVAGPGGILRTTDGANFALVPGGPMPASRVAVDSVGSVYVTSWRSGAASGGLWRWAGGKWSRLNPDQYIGNVAVCPTNPKRIAIITQDHPYHDESFATGVYLSDNGGRTWGKKNAGLAQLRGEAIAFDPFRPERLIVGTLGRGYFSLIWPMTY